MNNVKLEVKPTDKGMAVDPATVVTVVGILAKLPLSDFLKGLLVKLFIFAFGIFCGIGIVYKSGLLPETPPVPAPAANVSAYQKRIDELTQENAALHKLLEEQPVPVLPPQPVPLPRPFPRPFPTPFPTPTPVDPDGVRPGVIIPIK